MKILVTGASGFLGAAACLRFRALDWEVVAVQRCPSEAEPEAVLWDMAEPPRPAAFPERVDAVVHLAQSRAYRNFPGDAAEMFAVNVGGAQALLDLAVDLKADRFCLLSSGNVYEPYARPMGEDQPLAPAGYLGASKLAAEVLAAAYADQFDLSVLRLFQPYGPGQEQKLVPDLVRRVRTGETITLAGGEGPTVCPTEIDDVLAVIAEALQARWTGVYNVAGPEALTIGQMAQTIGAILQTEPVCRIVNGAPPRIVPDTAKLKARFDTERFSLFREGVARLF